MLEAYYNLTKPGIIYGNAITAIAGFLLASKDKINLGLFVATIAGVCLVIASACVFNNYIDRGIDKQMARTKNRALVKKTIPAVNALIYGAVLGLVGFIVLIIYTNALTVFIGLVAFATYVILYGISKRRTVHGTLVGSIAGSAPIVAGYCAVTDRFDGAALLLFLILAFWQMPHFYSIAMYRHDDYKAAGLPVLPVKKGIKVTKIQIVLYVTAFIIACVLLRVLGYANNVYLAIIMVISLAWLSIGLRGFRTTNDKVWARKMFFFSLVTILGLSFALSINGLV